MNTKSGYQTLSYTQMPYPMRHSFIETGYRLLYKPWSYYYASLVKWHNETLNVWTHVIAAIIIFYYGCRLNRKYDMFYSSEGNKLLIYIFGCVILATMSSIAHLFGSKSVKTHVIFFLVDYSGIALYGYTTSVGSLYICGEIRVFETLRPFYLWLGVVLVTVCFASNCGAKILIVNETFSPIQKWFMVAPYVLFALYASVPILPRYWYCYKDNECALSSLNYITLCYVFFILEAIIYSLHIPERRKPKSFDYCGQSHQIFHVCVLVTMTTQIQTVVHDIASGHSSQFEFDLWKSLTGYVCLMVSLTTVVVFYLPYIDKLSKRCTSIKKA